MEARVLALFTLITLGLLAPAMAQTTTIQEPSPVKKAIALNEPAVLLIYEAYNATFSVPSAKYQIDSQGIFHFSPQAGLVSQQVQSAGFGSGFAITPDGYIVTNAHVATSQEAQLQFLFNVVSSTLQTQLKQGAFSDQLSQNFESAYFSYLQSYGTFSHEQNSLVVFLPFVSVTGELTARPASADVKVAGDMTGTGTEKDVAIVKIVADHPLPTVQVGDSNSASPGDSIVIIGYPGIAASTQNVAGIESFIPTATAGIVSALKPMPEGWTVIQTDATVHHGNSGGPAFDANGKVIGIATFLGLNPQLGESGSLAGINFLIPINMAKQFADKISVQNTRGQLDQDWQLALGYFWAHHYSAAIQEFNLVLGLYPGDPYVAQYVQQANTEITNGNDIPLSSIISGRTVFSTLPSTHVATDVSHGATPAWNSSGIWVTLLVAVGIVVALTWFIARQRPKKRFVTSVPLPQRPRFCTKCGTMMRRQTGFCTRCGARLTRQRFDRT